jgi:hypothetical protein
VRAVVRLQDERPRAPFIAGLVAGPARFLEEQTAA